MILDKDPHRNCDHRRDERQFEIRRIPRSPPMIRTAKTQLTGFGFRVVELSLLAAIGDLNE